MTSSRAKTEYSLPMLRALLRGELEVDGEKKIYDNFGTLITSISITNKTLYTNLIADLTHTANIGKGIKQNGAAIAALTAAKKLESLTSFTVEEKILLTAQETLTPLLNSDLSRADKAEIKNKLREIERRLVKLKGTKSKAEIELAIQNNQKVTEKDAGLIEGAKIEAKAAIKYALENYVTPKSAADKPATLSTKDLASKTPKKTKTVTGKLDSYQAKDTEPKTADKTKTEQKQVADKEHKSIKKDQQFLPQRSVQNESLPQAQGLIEGKKQQRKSQPDLKGLSANLTRAFKGSVPVIEEWITSGELRTAAKNKKINPSTMIADLEYIVASFAQTFSSPRETATAYEYFPIFADQFIFSQVSDTDLSGKTILVASTPTAGEYLGALIQYLDSINDERLIEVNQRIQALANTVIAKDLPLFDSGTVNTLTFKNLLKPQEYFRQTPLGKSLLANFIGAYSSPKYISLVKEFHFILAQILEELYQAATIVGSNYPQRPKQRELKDQPVVQIPEEEVAPLLPPRKSTSRKKQPSQQEVKISEPFQPKPYKQPKRSANIRRNVIPANLPTGVNQQNLRNAYLQLQGIMEKRADKAEDFLRTVDQDIEKDAKEVFSSFKLVIQEEINKALAHDNLDMATASDEAKIWMMIRLYGGDPAHPSDPNLLDYLGAFSHYLEQILKLHSPRIIRQGHIEGLWLNSLLVADSYQGTLGQLTLPKLLTLSEEFEQSPFHIYKESFLNSTISDHGLYYEIERILTYVCGQITQVSLSTIDNILKQTGERKSPAILIDRKNRRRASDFSYQKPIFEQNIYENIAGSKPRERGARQTKNTSSQGSSQQDRSVSSRQYPSHTGNTGDLKGATGGAGDEPPKRPTKTGKMPYQAPVKRSSAIYIFPKRKAIDEQHRKRFNLQDFSIYDDEAVQESMKQLHQDLKPILRSHITKTPVRQTPISTDKYADLESICTRIPEYIENTQLAYKNQVPANNIEYDKGDVVALGEFYINGNPIYPEDPAPIDYYAALLSYIEAVIKDDPKFIAAEQKLNELKNYKFRFFIDENTYNELAFADLLKPMPDFEHTEFGKLFRAYSQGKITKASQIHQIEGVLIDLTRLVIGFKPMFREIIQVISASTQSQFTSRDFQDDNSDTEDFYKDKTSSSRSSLSFSRKQPSVAPTTPKADKKETGFATTMRKAFGFGKKNKEAKLAKKPEKLVTQKKQQIPSEYQDLNLTAKEQVELKRMLARREIDKVNAEKNMHAWRHWGSLIGIVSRVGTDIEAIDNEAPVGETHKDQLFHKYCRLCNHLDKQNEIKPSSLAKLRGMFDYTYDTDPSFRTLPFFRGHFGHSNYLHSGSWDDFNKFKLNRRNDPYTNKPKEYEDPDNRYSDFDEWVNRVIIPYPKDLETSVLTKAEQAALNKKLAGTSFFPYEQEAVTKKSRVSDTPDLERDSQMDVSSAINFSGSGLDAYYAIAHQNLSKQEQIRRRNIDQHNYQRWWPLIVEWAAEIPIVSRKGTDFEAIQKNYPKTRLGFWQAFRACICLSSSKELQDIADRQIRPLVETYLDSNPRVIEGQLWGGNSIFTSSNNVIDWEEWNIKMGRGHRGGISANAQLPEDFEKWVKKNLSMY